MNPYESVWTHVPIVPGHFITLWLLILLLSLFQALRETSFFNPFVSREVLWWSSRACSARCQANAKASRNCSAKLKRRPEKNHEAKNVQKLHTLVTLTSAWHSDANKRYMQSVHRWSFWNMKEPRNVRSGEIGPESFGASQILPEEHGSVLVPKLNQKTSNEDAPGRSTHLHEGPHLLTSSSPKNKGCREKPPLRSTPRHQLLTSGHDLWRSLIVVWLEIGPQNGATIVTRMTNVAILKYLQMAALILSHCHLHPFIIPVICQQLMDSPWSLCVEGTEEPHLDPGCYPAMYDQVVPESIPVQNDLRNRPRLQDGRLVIFRFTGTNAYVVCSKKMQTSMY